MVTSCSRPSVAAACAAELPALEARGEPDRYGGCFKVCGFPTQEKEPAMMNGYGMGFGWIWMIVILILVGLMIAALIKYLQK